MFVLVQVLLVQILNLQQRNVLEERLNPDQPERLYPVAAKLCNGHQIQHLELFFEKFPSIYREDVLY